uniref:Transposase n=1 Tax=Acrobeloides nanus TaxID=290746 RepID=A0A914DLB4_9BILA
MESRIILMDHYVKGRRSLPDGAISLRSNGYQQKSARIDHALELNMPTTQLEAVLGSSLNTIRKIWNSLPADVVKLGHPSLLKTSLSDGKIYQTMGSRNTELISLFHTVSLLLVEIQPFESDAERNTT